MGCLQAAGRGGSWRGRGLERKGKAGRSRRRMEGESRGLGVRGGEQGVRGKGKGEPVGQGNVGKKPAGWRWGSKGVKLTFAASLASASASPPPPDALQAARASLQSVCSHQSLCCQFPPTVVWQRWHRHRRGRALYRRRCAGGEGETEPMMSREDEIGTGGLAGATCQQHVNMT